MGSGVPRFRVPRSPESNAVHRTARQLVLVRFAAPPKSKDFHGDLSGSESAQRLSMHIGERLKARTQVFASQVVRLCLSMRRDDLVVLVRAQLLRAGTGVACNYRAACRSRSDKEFASRLAVAIEEADEAE